MSVSAASVRVPLGRTSLTVSRLGLGTAPLAGLFEELDETTATATLRRALELGIAFFDTAPLYGYGLAERRTGAVLSGVPRDRYVLASKVGRLLRADAPPDPTQYHGDEPFYKGTPPVNPVFDFSRDGVLRSLEESLERLGLDRIDILHVHDPDEHVDEVLAETFPVLAELRAQGVIGAVGAGMNQAAALARFAREADFDCFLLAGRYTLLDQTALDDLLPTCADRGIAIIAAGVYNSGVLANPVPGATFDYVPAGPERLERAQRIKAVCARYGVELVAAATQFPLGHPAVVSVLTSARSVEQLEANVASFDAPVPGDLWAELRAEGLLGEEVPVPG